MEKQSTTKRVAKNTGFLYIKVVFNMFVSLYATRVVLNALGIEDFGIFNVVGGVVTMLTFLNSSMVSVTQRFMNYSEGEGDKHKKIVIFNVAVVLHAFIALLVGVIMLATMPILFSYVLNIAGDRLLAAKWIYLFSMFSTLFSILTVPYDAVLTSHENMGYYSVVGIVESTLKLIAALALSYLAYDRLISYGLFIAVISVLVLVLMRIYCKSHYAECVFQPKKYLEKQMFYEVSKYAGWNFLGSSSSTLSYNGLNVILNNFFGATLNAAAGVQSQIQGYMLTFSTNLQKALNPVIVKYEGAGNREKVYQSTFVACKLSVMLYTLFAIPLFVHCDWILSVWLKMLPAYAVIFCQMAVVQKFFEQISSPLDTAINAIGRIKLYNVVTSIFYLLQMLVLYVAFACGGSPIYFLLVMVVVAMIQTFFRVWYCASLGDMDAREYAFNVLGRTLIAVLLTFGIAYAFSRFFIGKGFLQLISIGFDAILFTVIYYCLGLSQGERAFVSHAFITIKNKLNGKNK